MHNYYTWTSQFISQAALVSDFSEVQVETGRMVLLRLRCGQSELFTCPAETADGGTVQWNEEFIFDMDSAMAGSVGDSLASESPSNLDESRPGLELDVWLWGDGSKPGTAGSPGPAGSDLIGQATMGFTELRQNIATSAFGSRLGAPLRLSAPHGRHPAANVRTTDRRVHVQTEDSAGYLRVLTAFVASGSGYEFCAAGCGAALPAGLMRFHLLICPSVLVNIALCSIDPFFGATRYLLLLSRHNITPFRGRLEAACRCFRNERWSNV